MRQIPWGDPRPVDTFLVEDVDRLVAFVREAAIIKPGRSGLALHVLGMKADRILRELELSA